MSKICTLALLLGLIPAIAFSQEAENEFGWKKEMIGGLNVTQSQYSNWSEGGVNALAAVANLKGKFSFSGPKWNRSHTLHLAFGQVKQDTLDFRKASDIIFYSFQATYKTAGNFKPTFLIDARSQFAPAYDYSKPSEPRISDLLAPAYIAQTLGVSYEPTESFNTLIGISAKETVVRVPELRASFGVNPDESLRIEAGLNSITNLTQKIAENVNWKSQLGVFVSMMSPEDTTKEWAPDIRWDNIIGMKVNDFLNVNLEVSTVFDTDVSEDVQLREVLSLGFTYSFM